MDVFFALLINGLATGGIYGSLATGMNLMLLVAGIFQYSLPHMTVICAYILWGVEKATGSVPLAITAAVFSGVGISLATEPLFRPLAKRGAQIQSFIIAMGIMQILADIMQRLVNKGVPIGFPKTITAEVPLFRAGIATLTQGQLAVIVGSIGAVIGLLYLLYRTKQGGAFRAIAQNPFVARILGIPVVRSNIYTFALSGLMAGIGGVFLAMTLGSASGTLASTLSIKVLAVAIFAGLGNLRGGLICGLLLGLVESFMQGYVSGEWANTVAFGMILVVVMFKQEGVFGTRG
ncbi:branched-chain amino acid ABC transporter permease [Chloroflexota bacterium]